MAIHNKMKAIYKVYHGEEEQCPNVSAMVEGLVETIHFFMIYFRKFLGFFLLSNCDILSIQLFSFTFSETTKGGVKVHQLTFTITYL